MPFPLEPSLVLLGRRGSEAHGTYVPPTNPDSIDDRDLMGVCIPPAPWTIGLRQWEGSESIRGVWDVVLYDFRKFVRLLTFVVHSKASQVGAMVQQIMTDLALRHVPLQQEADRARRDE